MCRRTCNYASAVPIKRDMRSQPASSTLIVPVQAASMETAFVTRALPVPTSHLEAALRGAEAWMWPGFHLHIRSGRYINGVSWRLSRQTVSCQRFGVKKGTLRKYKQDIGRSVGNPCDVDSSSCRWAKFWHAAWGAAKCFSKILQPDMSKYSNKKSERDNVTALALYGTGRHDCSRGKQWYVSQNYDIMVLARMAKAATVHPDYLRLYVCLNFRLVVATFSLWFADAFVGRM